MCSGSGVRRRQREVAAIEEGFSSEGGGESYREERGLEELGWERGD
jgi:hypothetical protein